MTKKRHDSRDNEKALERHQDRERSRERALDLHYEQDHKHSPVRDWEGSSGDEMGSGGDEDDRTPATTPPSPESACDPNTEARFAGLFEKKAQGFQVNESIKKRKDYKNPALYDSLVQKFGIDEKGTNFPATVYNPNGFTQDDHYEALAEYQKKQMEAEQRLEDQKQAKIAEQPTHTSRRR